MKKKKWLGYSIILLIIFVIYTILVLTVDKKGIGPNESMVGFSTLNSFFHKTIGTNMKFYTLTKYLGLLPMLFVFYYGLYGLLQLIDKKKISKVDKKIIILGCFYIVFVLVYVFFEKCIINYRPILLEGKLEASYPSSHTMLAICFCGSSIIMSKYYMKKSMRKSMNILSWSLMGLIVIGRILSGVHWITDIIGGIIISLFLLCSLYTALLYTEKQKKE